MTHNISEYKQHLFLHLADVGWYTHQLKYTHKTVTVPISTLQVCLRQLYYLYICSPLFQVLLSKDTVGWEATPWPAYGRNSIWIDWSMTCNNNNKNKNVYFSHSTDDMYIEVHRTINRMCTIIQGIGTQYHRWIIWFV